MAMKKLEIKNLSFAYANMTALEGVSFDVEEGEFVSIVGPSGCGKSTLLGVVDGLNPATGGQIIVGGKEVREPGYDRALVFQEPSLLPWRTVLTNVTFGLECQNVPKKQAKEKALSLINLVGLNGFSDSYPYQLSGGMQQRVNLARALAVDPEILLMDEPFAALDAQTRELMQAELLSVWQRTGKTVLFVTHQIDEAIYLSDRVIVFSGRPGRVVDIIIPKLSRPRDLSVKHTPEFLASADRIWALIQSRASPSAEVPVHVSS
ncbi:NitT/TauT family transport system ATP-binding protein [Rhodoligotrophos appendicifer]|uniref:ABC transporter ATP-binding protein n=1 Tax=Rhodoligotrophos appendicifer TaxID=987056 RepID=UPI00195F2F6F|nr:ABC transporter ATP-binding protein [Rhodoligotrophos appendicifer]